MKSPIASYAIVLTISFGALSAIYADSATWNLDPISSDWNTAANWTPNTVPNAPTDIATFAVSNTTTVAISTRTIVDSIIFSPGASAYTIAAPGTPLSFSGTGVVNDSGVVQNFYCVGAQGFLFTRMADAGSLCLYTISGLSGAINFEDQATAGSATFVAGAGGVQSFGSAIFSDDSSAANGTFIANGSSFLAGPGGHIIFNDNTTAADAVLTAEAGSGDPSGGLGGYIAFYGSSSAGNCTITNSGALPGGFNSGTTSFNDTSTAATAVIINEGASSVTDTGGETFFEGGTAASAVITNEGGKVAAGPGGVTSFTISSAGQATITNNGGAVEGAYGAVTIFARASNAEDCTLIINGGPASVFGGQVRFEGDSLGGTARIILSGVGSLDISNHAGRVTVGSVEGEGEVYLGKNPLMIGSNNLSSELAAAIQDGGYGGGTGGSLTKVGTGTLTLTGANTYTGGTRVSAGTLMVANTEGSGTGTGVVVVTSGALAGSGTISGAVTIGTGASLAPAGGSPIQSILNLLSSLTFNGNANYTYTFRAKRNRATTDKVIGNGVTIASAATINLSGLTQGHLTQGLVLTLILNTSADPISGTFANLPDGGIVTINGNNLQASYSGGDGNDLTLTVVP